MNEKMKILKMLESGQITANEAAMLLSAIDNPAAAHPPPPTAQRPHNPASPPPPTPPPPPAPPHTPGFSGEQNSNTPPGPRTLTDDISKKFESFARDMAPKVQRFTETVADRILAAADRVGTTFAESSTGGSQSGHSRSAAPKGSAAKNESHVELSVDFPAHNELSISGLNGKINVTGYNGDKISARIFYRPKRHGMAVEFVKLGGKFFLRYEPDDFDIVSVDAFVPERAFNVFRVDGINTQIDLSAISADDISVLCSNGNIRTSGLHAARISIEGSGGALVAQNLSASEAKIENLNGQMDLSELDIENLHIQNFNAPLSLVMSQFDKHTKYMWAIETSNAKLNINLPTLRELGYHIKAHAAMSEIRLNLVGMSYLIHEPSLVEAKSTWYETAHKHLNLRAETSGGTLVIA